MNKAMIWLRRSLSIKIYVLEYGIVFQIASQNALCDYALYLGATPENIKLGKTLGEKCAGLKMYLNETFAALQIPSILDWIEHMWVFDNHTMNLVTYQYFLNKYVFSSYLVIQDLIFRYESIYRYKQMNLELKTIILVKQRGCTLSFCLMEFPNHSYLN